MKNLHALLMAQSMYCAIPFPIRLWDEEARPRMLLFLPVIGLEIGVMWWGLSLLCGYLPRLLGALVLTVFPFVVTGFIHLDGFLDVVDAVRSCRDIQKRLDILKDPHVGAFAVIGCSFLMLAQYSCLASGLTDTRVLIFLPAVSRCCSCMAVGALKPVSVSQFAVQHFGKKQIAANALTLLVLLAAAFVWLRGSALPLLFAVGGYSLALKRGTRNLGGMNGDIAGYSLVCAELAGLCAAVFL